MGDTFDVIASLPGEAWYTLGVVVLMLVVQVRNWLKPVVALPASLLLLTVSGVLEPEKAFSGFSNSAVLTIGALYVVVAGVQHTQALSFIDRALFSPSRRMDVVLVRLSGTSAVLSTFMNNTPLVAMLIPRVQGWAHERGIPVSKLLIPVSFAAVLGGTITLIGTSTNLLVAGWMESSGLQPITSLGLALVGIPAAVVGVVYLATIGYRLLPDRSHLPAVIEPFPKVPSALHDGNVRKAPVALCILGAMLLVSTFGLCPIESAALTAALAMVVTGCVREGDIMKSVDLAILIVLAAALGIGRAVEETGLALAGARLLIDITAGMGPIAVLGAVYLATNILTEMITNNAAALLMLPTGIATAAEIGVPPEAFAISVAIAASAGFVTPIGYQTHLMVITPGGYRFSDFARVGLFLNLIVMATTVTMVRLLWM